VNPPGPPPDSGTRNHKSEMVGSGTGDPTYPGTTLDRRSLSGRMSDETNSKKKETKQKSTIIKMPIAGSDINLSK